MHCEIKFTHNKIMVKSLKEFCKRLTKRYYERADPYSDPLIVEECKYAPHPHPTIDALVAAFWIPTIQLLSETPNT